MPLTPSSRLGPYEIVGPLGAGGMGEVFRARDTRLERDVAIKALTQVFARDPERLARFEREAKLLASLNHPNIAAIYGIEDSDGVPCLVLELVEGESLSGRLSRGPLPVREALDGCGQVAAAIEACSTSGSPSRARTGPCPRRISRRHRPWRCRRPAPASSSGPRPT
jgi:serine/threonine protein kinase